MQKSIKTVICSNKSSEGDICESTPRQSKAYHLYVNTSAATMHAILSALTLAMVAITTTTSPTSLAERHYAGKCTVGIESVNSQYPGRNSGTGGAGNTQMHHMYAYIVGSDGVRTNENVYNTGRYSVHASGNCGGIVGERGMCIAMIRRRRI
jgi:hypothetical protein